MSKDYTYLVCLDAKTCYYCPHAKPHIETRECGERVCSMRYVWCMPTKTRPQRRAFRSPRTPVFTNYRLSVRKSYEQAGLDLAEIDPTLTPHEQRAELQVKASGGRWWDY